jgi:hypothetical protein
MFHLDDPAKVLTEALVNLLALFGNLVDGGECVNLLVLVLKLGFNDWRISL